MSGDYALVNAACPACSMRMRLRADVVVDEDGDRVLDTEALDRGILLHLRLACGAVARGWDPQVVVEDEPVTLDEDIDP